MHKQINIRRMATERGWETKSGRWGDEKVEEKEDNWRDKQVGRGEREERHGSQSADTFKQVVLCCVLRDTSTQSLYTWKGEMFKCHCDLFSAPLSLTLVCYTPQHRVLIYKNKGQYESFELHRHTSLLWVRMSRPAIPIQSAVINWFFQRTEQTNVPGRADSPHAKSEDQVKYHKNHRCHQYGRALTIILFLSLWQHQYCFIYGIWGRCNDRTPS